MKNFPLILSTLLIFLFSYSKPIFAIEWVKRNKNKHYYAIVECGTWHQCNAEAESLGAYLVSINDSSEQKWIRKMTNNLIGYYWIGATDQRHEGNWKWVNGDPFTYSNWADGEPNDMWNCGEDFGIMNWSFSGKWNDLGPCSPEWFEVRKAIIESDD